MHEKDAWRKVQNHFVDLWFCCAPRVPITHLIHAIHRTTIHTRNTHGHWGKHKQLLPSKEGGKYLTSHASMLSKLVVLKSNLDLLLDFVNFNVLTILKPKQDGDNWKGGHGEGDLWRGSFVYNGPWGVLWTSIETKCWVRILVLKQKDDVSKRSTTKQTSSSESESRIIVPSLGFILTLATIDSWIVDMQELFVNTTMDAWT